MLRATIVLLAVWAIAFPAGYLLPWWFIAPVSAFVVFILGLKPGASFLVAFIAGVTLWGGLAFYLDHNNEGLLSTQMGVLFKGISSLALVGITALIGGITSGLGGWMGASLRSLLTS